jgi:uncharacterized protein
MTFVIDETVVNDGRRSVAAGVPFDSFRFEEDAMDFNGFEPGVPCWADVVCPDLAASASFYGALFGWVAPKGAGEFGGYRTATLRERPVVGLAPQMGDAPVVWSSYIATADADATSAAVVAAGGTVMYPPMDVGELGRMAVLVDTTGGVFGVWQAGLHLGAGICNEPNTMCWNELITTDVEASKAFYSSVFGWSWGGGGDYHEFEIDGRSVGGMMAKPPTMPAEIPSQWGVYFAVDDIDAAVARIRELGGALYVGPMDIEPGRMAVVADPAGAIFNVLALKPA